MRDMMRYVIKIKLHIYDDMGNTDDYILFTKGLTTTYFCDINIL